MTTPIIFNNQFAKGTSENANIGTGALVGIDTYTKKGVAQLTKGNTSVTYSGGGFTAFPNIPKYIASEGIVSGSLKMSMILTDASGYCHWYYSLDGGITWHDTGTALSGTEFAAGLIYYQGYYLAFSATKIYYYTDVTNPPGSTVATGLISGEHPTILFPANNNIYFGNGNTLGMIGAVPGVTFNPGGTNHTDYNYYPNLKSFLGFFPF